MLTVKKKKIYANVTPVGSVQVSTLPLWQSISLLTHVSSCYCQQYMTKPAATIGVWQICVCVPERTKVEDGSPWGNLVSKWCNNTKDWCCMVTMRAPCDPLYLYCADARTSVHNQMCLLEGVNCNSARLPAKWQRTIPSPKKKRKKTASAMSATHIRAVRIAFTL